jgi:hypothetical protein
MKTPEETIRELAQRAMTALDARNYQYAALLLRAAGTIAEGTPRETTPPGPVEFIRRATAGL